MSLLIGIFSLLILCAVAHDSGSIGQIPCDGECGADKFLSGAYDPDLEEGLESDYNFKCSLYLAPSSIKGAGFGIYTMRDISKDEKILPYSDAPAIVSCDDLLINVDEKSWNHPDYFWVGQGWSEGECKSVSEFIVNLGAMSNFHTV